MKTLQELTGQESGIVIFYGDGQGRPEAVICNWTSVEGLPRLDPFGFAVLGFGEEIEPVEPEHLDDIAEALEGAEIVFSNDEYLSGPAKSYQLEEHHALVLAPEGWA